MEDEREAKRARQACENCRRKKTRCSGERPACQFCIRLGQTCTYARKVTTTIVAPDSPSSNETTHRRANSSTQSPSDLATRLALIEARLGLGSHNLIFASATNDNLPQSVEKRVRNSLPRSQSVQSASTSESNQVLRPFSTVPSLSVLQCLADVYFSSCHNQPYCFFYEPDFRHRLANESLPVYLLMAFVATVARYSTHVFFENRQKEAIETYSKSAWQIVLQQVFSSEQGLDLHVVQATNLLAVIDFTAGQHRLGWVKIGLAVRFAQGLRLNAEPDPNALPWEQEERRRVFWSVYLLDRFVSCCRLRPPSILDVDCTVMLPTSEHHLQAGAVYKSPTLSVLKDLPDMSAYKSLDHSGLLVLVASTLGRIVRYNLQHNNTKGYPYPPWDFRSDFAKISTILLSFETLLSVGEEDMGDFLQSNFGTDQGFDRARVGHFIWSRGLYHLCFSLLHHPFFLYRHLKHHRDTFPHSFIRASVRHCKEHAEAMTNVLQVVYNTDCCARGSFLGYFAVVAGSVHKLYEHSTELTEQTRARNLYQICLDFLQQGPIQWGNYPRMATALAEFHIDQPRALALIETRFSQHDIGTMESDDLSRILDYGWLSDANRVDQQRLPDTPQAEDSSAWSMFDELIGASFDQPVDVVGHSMGSLMQKKSLGRQWWVDENSGGLAGPSQILDFPV